MISGRGKGFKRRAALESIDGPRTILYRVPVTSLIILCVLIYSILFVIDCLNGRSSNKKTIK